MNKHQRRVPESRRLPDGSLVSYVRLQVRHGDGSLGVDYPTDGQLISIVNGERVRRRLSDDELHRYVN